MSEKASAAPDSSQIDWRDKELRRKHARLQQYKRENEKLKRVLDANGIQIPTPDEDERAK